MARMTMLGRFLHPSEESRGLVPGRHGPAAESAWTVRATSDGIGASPAGAGAYYIAVTAVAIGDRKTADAVGPFVKKGQKKGEEQIDIALNAIVFNMKEGKFDHALEELKTIYRPGHTTATASTSACCSASASTTLSRRIPSSSSTSSEICPIHRCRRRRCTCCRPRGGRRQGPRAVQGHFARSKAAEDEPHRTRGPRAGIRRGR